MGSAVGRRSRRSLPRYAEGFERKKAIMPKVQRWFLSFTFPVLAIRLSGSAPITAWSAYAAGTVGWDDNVYLQSNGPMAQQDSLVVGAWAEIKASRNGPQGSKWTASYAPEAFSFLAETGEDFQRHRVAAGWTGTGSQPIEFSGSVMVTDGPDTPSIWTERGGPPAGGGPSVRDRRDATVLRAKFTAPFSSGSWIFRPLLNGYIQDFRSQQLTVPGCQNSVDRAELITGLDAGRPLRPRLSAYLGYRYGAQRQERLFGNPERYSNTFQQVLVSLEGRWTERWSLRTSVGPEWRRYGQGVATGFGDRTRERMSFDLSLIGDLGPRDRLTLCARQHELPGSSGRSIYEDTVYEANWTHRFGTRWNMAAVGRAERFNFRAPVARDDWVTSLNVQLALQLSEQLTLRAEILRETGKSELPDLPGREYDRTYAGISVRWSTPAH